jgi:hypothetical protein
MRKIELTAGILLLCLAAALPLVAEPTSPSIVENPACAALSAPTAVPQPLDQSSDLLGELNGWPRLQGPCTISCQGGAVTCSGQNYCQKYTYAIECDGLQWSCLA